jgi:hypothetical protein
VSHFFPFISAKLKKNEPIPPKIPQTPKYEKKNLQIEGFLLICG